MATPFIIKKGLSSALTSQSIVAGTIYFCTDTGEMYVGIADGEKTKITDLSLLNKITNITPITLKNYELYSQGEYWTRNEQNEEGEGIDSDIVDISIYNMYIDIPMAGVTADMIPEVIFDANVALSGNFAPIAKAIEGFVRLYGNTGYSDLTIPIITCRAPGTVIEVTA